MGGEIKMMGSLDKKPQQWCKVEQLTGSDAGDIEDEINDKLADGWLYADIFAQANKVYILFIR
jgi:hypothetical protein